jgi:hypothetical protein
MRILGRTPKLCFLRKTFRGLEINWKSQKRKDKVQLLSKLDNFSKIEDSRKLEST